MPISDPKCRKCRRAGEKLFLKGEKCDSAKCPMVKRNFPPGMHGSKGSGRLTNYGKQLKEKQKAKRIYGLREKQFRNYFDKAFRKLGNTAELLFSALESRLDSSVYRLGFAPSRAKARQLVSHGHFRVNGRKVNIPSFQVKIDDEISIKDSSLKMPVFEGLVEKMKNQEKTLVPWLSIDSKESKGKMTSRPSLKECDVSVDWRMIIEFYSK